MYNPETNPLACPFCGAPQRKFISYDTVQVKCQYCGAIFFVRPQMSEDRYRCVNHPDKLSIGICNDCGESFCRGCLTHFELGWEAVLYLCPDCLRRRYISNANREILGGIFLLIFGIIGWMLLPLMGIFFIIIGLSLIIHGRSERAKKLKELKPMKNHRTNAKS